jgi:hypothetical protein
MFKKYMLSIMAVVSLAAHASVTVTSPASGTTSLSPVHYVATSTAPTCKKGVASMGIYVNNVLKYVVQGNKLNTSLSFEPGTYDTVVQEWDHCDGATKTSIPITIINPLSVVPSTAVSIPDVQSLSTWKAQHDPATGNTATSTGTMTLVDGVRTFVTSYTNAGGELYWATLGSDTTSHNFFYDGWVYLPSPSTNVANVELDFDQVLSNGDTIIFGFQCDGYNNVWDYNEQSSIVTNAAAHWVHSTQPCNPRKWSTNTWHHVQIYYSRDDAGNATYHTVWLDNVPQDINATVYDEFALKWGSVILTNLQVDGVGPSGTATVSLENLTIYRW